MPGTLYIVATPLGNLEDMTFRAVRILKEVSLIACEDTRQTGKLLQHFEISTPAISYHEHNERERADDLTGRLRSGSSVALVSDAGTPLISDPGYRLVSAAAAAGIPIVPIPGPCAAVTAASVSGLPTDRILFAGFLPPKPTQRVKILSELKVIAATLVFYESPHRILETLEDVAVVLGNRPLVAGREMTKLHEEFLRGTPREVAAVLGGRPSVKGEFTLVVGRAEGVELPETTIAEAFNELQKAGIERMEAIKQIARERSLAKREVYEALEKEKG